MKSKILILTMLLAIFACEKTTEDPVSETDADKIRSEVKEIVNTIFKGCEEVNHELVLESCYDSPDFIYLFNGTTLTYTGFTDALQAVYLMMTDQKIAIINEKITVLDISTVLYTANLTFLQHFKDGTSYLADPAAMLFIFRKIDGRWRWVYGVESYGKPQS